jgi:ATPase subunit of ABC transporter with duplicated ATPase domains
LPADLSSSVFRPHLLLLDEPTNNLDLDAIRALKDAIVAYPGACLITSHDTAFISNCACSAVYHLCSGNLTRLENGVAEYRQLVKEAVKKQKKSRL